ERARQALASRGAPQAFDRLAARAELEALVDRAGTAGA
ncbi:MAG TPA: beta-hexosaminidase, partial [Bradyrhizobium sp.]|nr:beta-hexosaminidase [Bradyrhizobium sp.]